MEAGRERVAVRAGRLVDVEAGEVRTDQVVTGLAPDIVLPWELRFGVARSATEVRERVRAILYGGADFIKVLATGAVLTLGTRPGAVELTEEEMRAAVEESAACGTWVAAHAHGADGIKNAVRAGGADRPRHRQRRLPLLET
jgi:imidazolonepropionase-like amidohydrolase